MKLVLYLRPKVSSHSITHEARRYVQRDSKVRAWHLSPVNFTISKKNPTEKNICQSRGGRMWCTTPNAPTWPRLTDNSPTAMTEHQEEPSSGLTLSYTHLIRSGLRLFEEWQKRVHVNDMIPRIHFRRMLTRARPLTQVVLLEPQGRAGASESFALTTNIISLVIYSWTLLGFIEEN